MSRNMRVGPPLQIRQLESTEKMYTLSNESENSLWVSNSYFKHSDAQTFNWK